MGSTTGDLRIYLRASRHNSEQDDLDNRAIDALKLGIAALIDSDPNFQRVAPLGVEGGV